jgi:alpha-beta hydrolase superfamily lysophospholipase
MTSPNLPPIPVTFTLSLFHSVLVVLVITLVACSMTEREKKASPALGKQFFAKGILMQLQTLDLSRPPQAESKSIQAYNQFYGFDFPDVIHFTGYFESEDRKIWSQVFLPANPAGTLFLLHGYFDHAGILKNLISYGLKQRFAIAVFDLPGHGLSSGDRGAIGSFAEYVSVLKTFIDECSEYLPPPFHLIAHSTGGSIAYEYLNQTKCIVFDKVVLLAPLVHNAHWFLSTVGYHLAKPFTDTIKRIYRKNSSDEQFLEFSRNDPLQNNYLSIRFLDALHTWNRKIREYDAISKSMLVIQGTDDIIVDWKYNLNFLKSKIIGLEIELVDEANHQLINESNALRQQVLHRIFAYIDA